MKNIEKIYWQIGVRDLKDWSRWHHSKEYESFEALMAASAEWLKANPRRVFVINTRKAIVLSEE